MSSEREGSMHLLMTECKNETETPRFSDPKGVMGLHSQTEIPEILPNSSALEPTDARAEDGEFTFIVP